MAHADGLALGRDPRVGPMGVGGMAATSTNFLVYGFDIGLSEKIQLVLEPIPICLPFVRIVVNGWARPGVQDGLMRPAARCEETEFFQPVDSFLGEKTLGPDHDAFMVVGLQPVMSECRIPRVFRHSPNHLIARWMA